ncbi:ABC transporter permease [Parafilimonas terrae]|uniref:Putative ABC transport system permease protein n=1 Tax=Parafilimonas terrae TaxID=1465490 RepID=A0A1I5VTB5_9BACT|nr:ABC transporter permease [Parafilimonas terrae]SFQ10691.1 putative ABC transport system permease protein [Parafilimonas terrae]
MFKNYFKTAWRNLVKNKFYSVINIAGLSIGLTVGLLILLWVQDEYSYDRFHKNAPNIIKLENMVATGSARQLWTVTTAPIGEMAKKEIPGVKDVVRVTENYYYGLYKYGDKVFSDERTVVTDPSFFSMFDFNIIKGNAANPFPDSRSVVLTETTAKKFFGNDDAIGKVITTEYKDAFKVTGIIKDFPKNSTIQGDMIFPMSLVAEKNYSSNTDGKNINNDFSNFDYNTYLLLQPGFSFEGFAKKLRNMHLSIKPDDTDIGYVWLPLNKVHLYRADDGDGGIGTVRMFTIIAILILVIACINYVNLSTARSMLRAKEVSLRKIVGAARTQLFLQFITETALLFVIAIIISLVLVYSLIPVFNTVASKEIVLNFTDYHIWKIILCTIAGTLVISSIYPALLLSSFEPVKALKGKINANFSNAAFRKVLVVVQFTFSIILITGTIVIGKQLQYINSKQLGYDKENVLSMKMIYMAGHLEAVKAELLKQPGIKDVTFANADIIDFGNQTGNNDWDGKQTGETVMLSPININKNFIPFFKMQLIQGGNFTGAVADSMHFILNETAVKTMRIKDPVGKRLRLWETEGTIIGVVKDFHFTSMRTRIKPAVFYAQPLNYGNIYIKTTGKDVPAAIAAAQKEWKKYNANYPFKYSFLDDNFNRLYAAEQRTGLLFNIFAGIAIFISCLGLFGLAAYTAQVRTKEIGVRKVLGASVGSVIQLLARDFIKLVIVAIVIATPVAWYAMDKWLQDFAYKINIGWSVFAVAGLLAVIIAIITISFQSIKAALANPVKSLRTE